MQFFGGSDVSPSPTVPTASGNNAHMMYVFNRNGVCLLYREWNRPLRTLDAQQDQKLMFGLLFSLKSLTAKMDPTMYFFFPSRSVSGILFFFICLGFFLFCFSSSLFWEFWVQCGEREPWCSSIARPRLFLSQLSY